MNNNPLQKLIEYLESQLDNLPLDLYLTALESGLKNGYMDALSKAEALNKASLNWVKASEKRPSDPLLVHWRFAETKLPIKEKVELGKFEACVPFPYPMRGSKLIELSLIEWLDENEH